MANFKPVFFSIVGTVLSAATIVLFRMRKRIRKTPASVKQAASIPSQNANFAPNELYKTAGIKHVEIKDIPETISITNGSGHFTGEALVQPTEHDKYNVNIVDENGTLVGHAEKNRRLSNSLSAWHHGQIFVFGKIHRNGDESPVTGYAFIPAGFKPEDIDHLKLVFEKLEKRHKTLEKLDISSEEYLKILEDHHFISEILKKMGISEEVDARLPKKIIPSLSKQLEDEQNWDGLIKLEQYSDLINELSERFAGTTYRRIGKARKMMGEKK